MGGDLFDRPVEAASGGAISAASQAAMKRSRPDDAVLPPNRVKDGEDVGLHCSAETPIVLAMDVTASRGDDSKIVYDKLPMFFGQMVMCGYCPQPSLSFAAIGDAPYQDQAPIQVCSWGEGTGLDDWIKRLWLEEGGGGSGQESYELTAYYYAKYAKLPEGKRGVFFFTGDEHYYDVLRKQDVKKFIGDDIPEDLAAPDVFKSLQEKFDVYMIYPQKGEAARQHDIEIEIQKRLRREGAKAGEITISLMWDNLDDLDLHVFPPGGQEISYANKRCCGGELDVDMNAGGACSNDPVENVFWAPLTPGVDGPPLGEYVVTLIVYTKRTSTPTNWKCQITISGESELFEGVCPEGGRQTVEIKRFSYMGPRPRRRAEPETKDALPEAKGYANASILRDWNHVIPFYRILKLQTPKAIVDVMLGVLAVRCGERTVSAYVKDLVERGQGEDRQLEVEEILRGWQKGEEEASVHRDLHEVKLLRQSSRDLVAENEALKAELAALRAAAPRS